MTQDKAVQLLETMREDLGAMVQSNALPRFSDDDSARRIQHDIGSLLDAIREHGMTPHPSPRAKR